MSDARGPGTSDGASDARYDVVVVGGGIHGAGVLQAVAAAGHSALLLESRGFASGTSSRSSKLIHGGLRYLETGQLRLVRESLREREILARVAPGLVRLVPFHIPVHRDTLRRPWKIRAGLSLYALLGGLARDARFASVPRAEWGGLDGLRTEGLEAVFRYFDGQTDDAALVRAVLRSAESLGARSACPAELRAAVRHPNGWVVAYSTGAETRECACSVLVNAGGPWVEDVRRRISPLPPGFDVELVGGTHIEVAGELARGVYYTEAPRDRRAVFVMPWKGRTLVGTTETPYSGNPADVRPTPDEIAYLQETFARTFPGRDARVLASFAGLRVLPRRDGSPFARPRETTLVVDDARAPRTVAVYGGKLTGYRATAEKVLRRIAPSLPRRAPIADTAELALHA